MILCSADNPGTGKSGLYVTPYGEAVDGYRHGYAGAKGRVRWTRDLMHPPDSRCPECAHLSGAVQR